MIQRAQTLYILIALGLMIAFFFVPFAYIPTLDAQTGEYVVGSIKAIEFTGLVIPVSICILLLAVAFLSFKTLNVQKITVIVSALLSAACIGVVVYVITSGMFDVNPSVAIRTDWGGGGLLLVGAVIAEIAAICSISSDQKKLRSYDRLR